MKLEEADRQLVLNLRDHAGYKVLRRYFQQEVQDLLNWYGRKLVHNENDVHYHNHLVGKVDGIEAVFYLVEEVHEQQADT